MQLTRRQFIQVVATAGTAMATGAFWLRHRHLSGPRYLAQRDGVWGFTPAEEEAAGSFLRGRGGAMGIVAGAQRGFRAEREDGIIRIYMEE